MSAPSYHDLYITTAEFSRASIFNLPLSLMVTCTRTSGWELWRHDGGRSYLVAGEYDGNGLRLDVAGHVIVDSLSRDAATPPLMTLEEAARTVKATLVGDHGFVGFGGGKVHVYAYEGRSTWEPSVLTVAMGGHEIEWHFGVGRPVAS